jgi:hypothetical protein
MPAGDGDHIGCFADQVKLTRVLVRDLEDAIKEVKLLGEHEVESSQKITELEVVCKRLREDAQRLRDKRTTLEGMIQSRDELILEMDKEYGLNSMGENDDGEDENDHLVNRVVIRTIRVRGFIFFVLVLFMIDLDLCLSIGVL